MIGVFAPASRLTLLMPNGSMPVGEAGERFGCERVIVQTGGAVNTLFLRGKLFDYVDLVAAPVLAAGIIASVEAVRKQHGTLF